MTAREIKDALRRNRRAGRWPSSLNQILIAYGTRSRSLMTMAVKNGRRYPKARRFIEAAIQGDVVARGKAS